MRILLPLIASLFLCVPALADQDIRTVTVTGTGSSSASPDRASVQMAIVASQSTVAAAQKEAAGVAAKVLKLTDQLGIERDKVDTTGSSVRAEYRWNRQREEQELVGYIAERQIRIDVRDLEKLGDLIEGATKAGVNQVSPPQLDSSKRRDVYREALDAAAIDAQANAAQLASSLGAQLGQVVQITTSSQPAPPMPYMRAAMADSMEASAPETYNAANLEFDATVTAVFELTN